MLFCLCMQQTTPIGAGQGEPKNRTIQNLVSKIIENTFNHSFKHTFFKENAIDLQDFEDTLTPTRNLVLRVKGNFSKCMHYSYSETPLMPCGKNFSSETFKQQYHRPTTIMHQWKRKMWKERKKVIQLLTIGIINVFQLICWFQLINCICLQYSVENASEVMLEIREECLAWWRID